MVTEGNYTYHCDELVMYKILNHCVVYLKLIQHCKSTILEFLKNKYQIILKLLEMANNFSYKYVPNVA